VPVNPDAVGSTSEPVRRAWTSKDSLLYAVGVGASADDPLDPAELQFTTENSIDIVQRTLPTFPVVIAPLGGGLEKIGSFNPVMVVHGEQGVTLHREVPVEGELEAVSTVVGIYDKGSGAVVVTETVATLVSDGQPLFTNTSSIFARGEGGFGGERGPSLKFSAPEAKPDHEVTYATRRDQALTYRLSGDRNPLHADPQFAKAAGFDRPILHGLCTYGFTGRALLHTLAGSDPARFRSISGRFSSPVFPGEDLTIRAWRTGEGEAVFQTLGPDGRVVLDAGRATFDE
jgi:acyl dehydratase